MSKSEHTDWRQLSQSALDAAYDQAVYAANVQQVIARYFSESKRTIERIGPPARYQYGEGQNEALDWFAPSGSKGSAPVVIMVHGGAWQAGNAAMVAFAAETVTNAGACYAALDFDPIGDHDGDLQPMADQVATAITWIEANAVRLGGDPARLFICAHSSGAHLAGCAIATMLPPGTIKGALLCGGIYDLAPVRASSRSSYVKLTGASEARLSPIRHLDNWQTPTIIAWGDLETPEFQRQSSEFASALAARDMLAGQIIGEHYNHFEVLETLGNPIGLLGSALVDLLKRGH